MNKKKFRFFFLTAILVSFIFFTKLVVHGQVPFPGDLLLGEYAPYNSYSFLGFAPGGYPNKGQDFDVLTLLYPAKEFSISVLKSGMIPLWNPYVFSGNPELASLQSGALYPFNVVFFLFPFIASWTIFILISPLLAFFFTTLFLKELKLSLKSSLFGGLIFAFSSYNVVWMEYGNIGHATLWLPLAFLAVLRLEKKISFINFLLLTLSLALSVLAGHIQISIYVYIFVLAFALFNIFFTQNSKIKLLLYILFALVLSLGLTAAQLFPSIVLFLNSARSSYGSSIFNFLIPPYHIVTLFVPDFFGNPATRNYWLNGTYIERVTYVGIVPLLFLVNSLFAKKTKFFWFFLASAVICLLLTFDTFIGRFIYSFEIPILSTSVPTRMMFIFSFCASVLAALGLEHFYGKFSVKNILKVVGVMSFVFILIWGFVYFAPLILKNSAWLENLSISKRNLIFPTLLLFSSVVLFISMLKVKKLRLITFYVIFMLTVFDLFYFFQKITPFAPSASVYPSTQVLDELKKIQGIDRSWGYGSAYIAPNIQVHEKIFTTDGYNALHIKRYGELVSSSENGVIKSILPRSDVNIASGFGRDDLKDNIYRQKIFNILGVKYILNKSDSLTDDLNPDYDTFDQSSYRLVWQGKPWQIYENLASAPRFFLTNKYVVVNTKKEAVDTLLSEKFDEKHELVLFEDPKINKNEIKSSSKLISYTPNVVKIQTNSSSEALLFLSDNYYSGWVAKIDGVNVKIYLANYSFRAVKISSGVHEVIFEFKPKSFHYGLYISIISIILLWVVKLLIVKNK